MNNDTLEIEELREAGSSGGDFMGYYARGHFDAEFFAERCNAYDQLDGFDRRYVRPKHVRHEYWRTVKVEDDPGEFQFNKSFKGPGAWAVTVAEPIMEPVIERMHLLNEISRLKNHLLKHGVPELEDSKT